MVWTYEAYLLVEKRFHSYVVLTREIFCLLENKLHMFAPPCNILFLSLSLYIYRGYYTVARRYEVYKMKISHSYPGCSFVWKIRVVYFSVEHSYLCNKCIYYIYLENMRWNQVPLLCGIILTTIFKYPLALVVKKCDW